MLTWCSAGILIPLGLFLIMASGGPHDGLDPANHRALEIHMRLIGITIVLLSILSIV